MSSLIALCCYILGIFLRYKFIFFWNNPVAKENIYNDMLTYFAAAVNFCNPAYSPTIADTVFPPGTSWLFGILACSDPTLKIAPALQFVLSSILPLGYYLLAKTVFSRRLSLWMLAISSLYFPFWEPFGFILSDGPFHLSIVLSILLFFTSLQQSKLQIALFWGFLAGMMLGVSASFKSVSIASASLIALGILIPNYLQKKKVISLLASALLGLLIVLVPLSIRATKLNEGRPLLIANDAQRSFLLGHIGRIGAVYFNDSKKNFHHSFGNPVFTHLFYSDDIVLDSGFYESSEIYPLAWNWIKNNPLEAVLMSIEHIFDMLSGNFFWPANSKPYLSWIIFCNEIFILFFLLPALLYLISNWREVYIGDGKFLYDRLFFLAALSIYIVAIVFTGEPRYRIPFDGFVMLLALRFYESKMKNAA